MKLGILPPLAPSYTIMECDLIAQTLSPAPISPNPGSDYEQTKDALDMLVKTTGKDYVVLINNQEWGHASFNYMADPIKGAVTQ